MAKSIAYATLCVVVPVAWGLLIYWVSTSIERRILRERRAQGRVDEEGLLLDYHI